MKLNRKIRGLTVRAETVNGRLVVEGHEVEVLPFHDGLNRRTTLTFSNHVPRHVRRLVFERTCETIATAALVRERTGRGPWWFPLMCDDAPEELHAGESALLDPTAVRRELVALGCVREGATLGSFTAQAIFAGGWIAPA